MKYFRFFVLLFSFIIQLPLAQAVVHDGQVWPWIVVQGPIQSSFRTYFEYQARFGEDFGRINTTLLRPAIGYQVHPQILLHVGYGWTPLYNPSYTTEQRGWQQATFSEKRRMYTLLNRFRIEERFIQGVADTAVRLRNQLRFNIPVTDSEDWWLVVWDEFFFHMNSASAAIKSGYDQNRAFVGMNVKVHPQIRLESGYSLVHVARTSAIDRLNHVIHLGAFLNFD